MTVTDDSGGANDSDTETVTITITGTNDAPVLTVERRGGGRPRTRRRPNLTDSGTLSFTDVDVNDTPHDQRGYSTDAVWTGGTLTGGARSRR